MADDNSILWSPYTNLTVTDPWTALNPVREPQNELDKDAFLQLLMTQMKYQDPLNPMDDKEFLGQMAQFTALEQMVNLNATYAKTQAYSMLGKTVTGLYEDPATGERTEVSGVVGAVTTKGSSTYLVVDGKEIALETVTAVGEDYFTSLQLDAIYSDVNNTRAQSLVGKTIQALIRDEEGNITDYVEGVVDYVKFVDNKTILVVGTHEVFPGEISSVSDGPLLLGKTIMNGTIDHITIEANKAKLHFKEGGEPVTVNAIGHLMDALTYMDKQIEHASIKGTVKGIEIRNGVPYFHIETESGEEQSLSYMVFKGL
jgi:flagellar basal-body rod modification protein FlgD